MIVDEKKITLPLCARIIGKSQRLMRFNLQILDVGLIVCNIKLINPYCHEEEFETVGLIDTGSDNTIISKKLFNKFKKIEPDAIGFKGLSTLHNDEHTIKTYPFIFIMPTNNIFQSGSIAGIKDFPENREYEVIIGIDILYKFALYYSRADNVAWIEY